jgi:phospholipid/cholesterol/gamma-HCH transport system substrate-binding protein
MSQARLEWKVGLFVAICLVLLGTLAIEFSKGWTFFRSTYDLRLKTSNVGGIKPGAVVLMAGVPVGHVVRTDLNPDGKSVIMLVNILGKYQIHRDARFVIETAGFLGDQYVSITSRTNLLGLLRPGDEVACEEPFNIQEVARSAAGLIKRVDETAAKLNEAVSRIGETFLSQETLTNLAVSVANFRKLSERSLATLDQIDALVRTNAPGVTLSISNFAGFSHDLKQTTIDLRQTVITNRAMVSATVSNLNSVTARADKLLADLQAGKGLIGGLLQDQHLRTDWALVASNFSVFSSNLNKYGLFYKPKPKPKIKRTIPSGHRRNRPFSN